jgi:hypothetical protein
MQWDVRAEGWRERDEAAARVRACDQSHIRRPARNQDLGM